MDIAAGLGSVHGHGWPQLGELALALALSSVIGLERKLRGKPAGLRTQAVVGLGAALFVLISKYGFSDVVIPNKVVLDPSRGCSSNRLWHQIPGGRVDLRPS